MSPAGGRRLAAVGAIAVAASALAYVSFGGIEDNLVYFWNVEELLGKGPSAHGSTVRLGGMVQQGSYAWNDNNLELAFRVGMKPGTDGPSVAVQATGAPPQMFREGIGVVVEGRYDGSVFHGDRVIVKHNNEYKPPAEGEKPQDLYKTLVE